LRRDEDVLSMGRAPAAESARLSAPLRSLLLLAAACTSSAPAPAAQATPELAPVPVPEGARGPLLWEVKGEAGTSYLFGTIHVGYDAYRELPDLVWRLLERAEVVVIEADLRAMRLEEVTRLSLLPENAGTLREALGPADFERLLALLGGAVPASAVEPLRPWAAYSLALSALHPTPIPLDKALLDRAVAAGRELLFLEDWRFQLELLTEVTDIDALRELVAPASPVRSRVEQMISSYRAGDFPALAALAVDAEEIAKNPENYRRLFDDRNRAWVPVLTDLFSRHRAFVAVGAGHFAGDHGLLALLRAEGLEIRRVGASTPVGEK
jgi:uncharacterized protein